MWEAAVFVEGGRPAKHGRGERDWTDSRVVPEWVVRAVKVAL